jgi:LysR family glycine cleavage system transcriptional activator
MNPRRLTPSMSLLIAFEASARHQSFARAAEELALTQSAVSRQVGVLEALLEVGLFQRNGKRIWLTDAGTMYARGVAHALDKLRGASLQAISFRSDSRALRLALLPTFGSKWLLPRLQRFYQQFPDIIVHIHTRVGEIDDFSAAGVDACVGVRDVAITGPETLELFPESLVVIVSPKLLEQHPIFKPSDLIGQLLLHVAARPQQWADWIAAHGITLRNIHSGPQFEVTEHLIQSVLAGIGIGLVPRVLVEESLARGDLIVPLPTPPGSTRCFCLSYPSFNAKLPQLIAFRDWLGAERALLKSD